MGVAPLGFMYALLNLLPCFIRSWWMREAICWAIAAIWWMREAICYSAPQERQEHLLVSVELLNTPVLTERSHTRHNNFGHPVP